MSKKVFGVAATFAIISISSIGFASWNVMQDPINSELNGGSIIADDFTKFTPSDYGFAFHDTLKTDSFELQGQTVDSVTSYTFTKTDLSFQFTVEKTNQKLIDLNYDDSLIYYLKIDYEFSSALNFFSDVLTVPETCLIYLSNTESNQMLVPATYSSEEGEHLVSINIPIKSVEVKSLYTLIQSDNSGDVIPFKTSFDFINNNKPITETQLNSLKEMTYKISMELVGK